MRPKRKTISAVNTIMRYLDNYSREERKEILADCSEVLEKDPAEFKVIRASKNKSGVIRLRPENEKPRANLKETRREIVEIDKEEERVPVIQIKETPLERDLRLRLTAGNISNGGAPSIRLTNHSLQEQADVMKDGWRLPLTKKERYNMSLNMKFFAKTKHWSNSDISKDSKKKKCYVSPNGVMYLMQEHPKYITITWRLAKSMAKVTGMTIDELISA